MKTTEELLKLFAGNSYPNPMQNEKYLLATDAHALIAIPKTEVVEFEHFTKSDSLIYNAHTVDVTIPVAAIKNVLDKIQWVDEYSEAVYGDECEACKGEGSVEYKFEFDYTTYLDDGDCPICEGDGKKLLVPAKKTGNKIPDYGQYIKMPNSVIDAILLYKLYLACEGLESIKMVRGSHNGEDMLFLVDDTIVLIMPTTSDATFKLEL